MCSKRPLLISVVILLTTACGGGVAATVGGTDITDVALGAEIDAMVANPGYVSAVERRSPGDVVDAGGVPTPGFVAGVLTMRIHYEVLRQEAAAQDVAPSDAHRRAATDEAAVEAGGAKILEAFDDAYREELVERAALIVAMRDAAAGDLTPRRLFEEDPERFVKPCTRHIVVRTKREADGARDRVESGEPFADVARDVSLDGGTAPKGGDLGCNGAGDLDPALDSASFAQVVGETGEPIRTDAGWQLLLVERRDAPRFERVAGEAAVALADLADARVGAALRRRFSQTNVKVAPRFGSWDGRERKVIVG